MKIDSQSVNGSKLVDSRTRETEVSLPLFFLQVRALNEEAIGIKRRNNNESILTNRSLPFNAQFGVVSTYE